MLHFYAFPSFTPDPSHQRVNCHCGCLPFTKKSENYGWNVNNAVSGTLSFRTKISNLAWLFSTEISGCFSVNDKRFTPFICLFVCLIFFFVFGKLIPEVGSQPLSVSSFYEILATSSFRAFALCLKQSRKFDVTTKKKVAYLIKELLIRFSKFAKINCRDMSAFQNVAKISCNKKAYLFFLFVFFLGFSLITAVNVILYFTRKAIYFDISTLNVNPVEQ